MPFVPGRDVDLLGAHGDMEELPARRGLAEVEADARPVGLGFARPVVVDQEDEVRPFPDDLPHAGGRKLRDLTGDPGPQPWLDEGLASALERDVTGAWLGRVETATLVGRVDVEPRVVDDPPVPGAELDCRDGHVALQGERQDERAEIVVLARGHLVRFGHGHDEVGRAELPPLGEHRRVGAVRRIALGRSELGPAGERRELATAQAAGVHEVAVAVHRPPGGHPPALGDLGEEPGPLRRVAVAQQRERSDLAGTMAARAMPPEERTYILVEGDRLVRSDQRRGLRQGAAGCLGPCGRRLGPGDAPRRSPAPARAGEARRDSYRRKQTGRRSARNRGDAPGRRAAPPRE